MKGLVADIAAAVILACSWQARAADSADAYQGLSARIAAYAGSSGVKKIVVADFAARGGAAAAEADYVLEKLSALLAGGSAPVLVERDYLKRIMWEVRGSSAASGSAYREKMLRELADIDAVVAGSVFAAGRNIRILVRLLDAKNGAVLFSAEAETRGYRPEPGNGRGAAARGGVYLLTSELPGILVPESPSVWTAAVQPSPPADLRDALSDSGAASCPARAQRLAWRNAALVDPKARYWALKMRAPGWAGRALGLNPGSELEEAETQARFYSLLAGYYKSMPAAPLAAGELGKIRELLEAEELYAADCARD
jgi:hypothetical protein